MKSRKDRFQYAISEASYNEMQERIANQCLKDGFYQGVAVCMLALELEHGWKKQRLTGFFSSLNSILHLPSFMGREVTAESAINRIRDLYEIDIDSLTVNISVDQKK